MSITASIRKKPWLLLGMIFIALLAFLINPDSMDKMFGKNPNILGKVNGEEITRDEFNDQLNLLQQQSQGQPQQGLDEQAWQTLVESKLIKQQFEKMGLKLTDEIFWNQIQFDPMFSMQSAPQNYDEKGKFKTEEVKKFFEGLKNGGDVNQYNQWLRVKKAVEYRMMARQFFANVTTGITANKKEAAELLKQRDQLVNIDFVKVDYTAFAAKNPVKVSTKDLENYIQKHPIMFKSPATRDLGIVFFPANPSAADDAAVLKEINLLNNVGVDNGDGLESFKNTPDDSLFVTINSDVPFNPNYFDKNQLPAGLKDKITNAPVGQIVGPYKEQNYYIAAKLLDKRLLPSDSVRSSHILFAYKGAERSTASRTKEEANALAEKTLAEIKANPAKFTENLKLSDEPDAISRGGSVGWTTSSSPFAPQYLQFLATHKKGEIGLAETSFGYHIIKIDERKESLKYKVAMLAKGIKASKETENKIYTDANTFIQSIQGKSFNEFANAAKKKNYNFQNPKSLLRFQGQIPGLATDKDEEILAWAFNDERKKGDVDILTTGNGDYIVFYLNGKQDAGSADPESVRDRVEPIVKNQLLAKKIIEKINNAKATSLDAIAKLFGTTKQSAQVNLFSPMVGGSMEPKVAGAAYGIANNKVSAPVEGFSGVYVVTKKSVTTNKQPGDVKQVTQAIQQQNAQMFSQTILKSLQDNADIKDYRIEVWEKAPKAK